MEDGLLSLKWNNHRSTFFHILSEVRGKQTYTDATLACEGKFFPVHKLVMSTCSDYFGEIFEKTPCKNPVVVLKDIKKSDLEALLDYMYIGEVDVRQSELAGLIKAAECLRIKGLAVPDEDPTKAHKKGPPVPDPPHSPPAKRKRRDSPSPPLPRGSSQSSSAAAAPVPSQAPPPSASVPESHVPSQPMPPPAAPSQEAGRARQDGPPSGHLHHPQLRGAPEGLRSPPGDSSHGAGASPRAPDPSILPVQMIKVEVDEGGEGGGAGRESHGGEREEGSEMDDNEEDASNDFSEYPTHTGEIEKEEHDQVDSYGTDQLPGPSGLQGGPPVLAWGEEGEAGFPHNLFGGDDAAAQQAYDGWAGGRGQKGEEGRAYTSERMGGGGGYKEEEEEDYEYDEEVPGGGGGGGGFRFAEGIRRGGETVEGAAAGSEGYEGLGVGYIRLGAAGGGEALPVLEPVVGFDPGADREPAHTQLTCPRCGRSYTHKSTLRRHLRAHEDDRPFGCDICDYRALQRSDLRRHMRTHTGERPYSCPHCEHRASQSGDLDRHIVSVHRDLSHACVMCTHLAPSRASMASHLRKKHA